MVSQKKRKKRNPNFTSGNKEMGGPANLVYLLVFGVSENWSHINI